MSMSQGHWRGRTSGGTLLIRSAITVMRWIRQPGVVLLSPPLALLGLAIDQRARNASMRYFRHLRPELSSAEHLGLAWRHLSAFGRVLCDRMLAYSDPQRMQIQFDLHGGELLRQAVASGRGCLLLSAHIGNWELAGQTLHRLGARRAHLVMIESEDPGVRALIRANMGDAPPAIIDPRDGFAASLAIHAALTAGDVVCMLADRTQPGQAWRALPFLGRPAPFPIGPFQIAAATGCQVVPCFLLKRERQRYVLYVDRPWSIAADSNRTLRRARIDAEMRRWVARLESVVRSHPFQWHNFSDFWRAP
jgi:predicted LPLAT superfamily acyltransferase